MAIWADMTAFVYTTYHCAIVFVLAHSFNKLSLRQNGRHFPDNIFKCIFLNGNVWILVRISLKFVSKGPINNIPALVQIMAWRIAGDKPLSEPMMVKLPTHICVTRPQWVEKQLCHRYYSYASAFLYRKHYVSGLSVHPTSHYLGDCLTNQLTIR